MPRGPDPTWWAGRRVLVTGHRGFKGSWLCAWLDELGAVVAGLGLNPSHPEATTSALPPVSGIEEFHLDIRANGEVAAALEGFSPDVVFHMAARSLVRGGYEDPASTYLTNVGGSAAVIQAAAKCKSRVCVVATSDKVYLGAPGSPPHREDGRLGGSDPYGSSKAMVEEVVRVWREWSVSPTRLGTIRAGNVVGGGDRGRDRLLPDVFAALRAGRPVLLRNPSSVRPWQFVLDALLGYLLFAEDLARRDPPPSLNIGPPLGERWVTSRVVETVFETLGIEASWSKDERELWPEASELTIDSSLARRSLGWDTHVGTVEAIRWTARWEKGLDGGADPTELTAAQIDDYTRLLLATRTG